ncbi:hypothetical protein PISMIDRAFT_651803 [Pisolithus microcarpus 441]|uniref:WD40 repeat-like protein n=1 Tax=Pisolithus microcarpus 441 TaxID=765257 RepID=A0A0C9Y2L6_9AGAM|nr:hypothetical protein PISMIDRAFT_651803 [Pisolithus microcarpus 441]
MSPVLGGITDCSSPVRPLHASFYDFLTDSSRSGVYCIATSDTKDLAFATLQTLCDELRFNICGLESSYLANVEVPDLLERINENILPHLSYSCRFWAQHLEKSTYEPALGKLVKDIIGSERIIFWLETMSLLGVGGKGVDALTSAVTWLLVNDLEDTLALAKDGIKFIQNFGRVMWHSTPHLYVSALPFIPPNTLLSAVLLPKFSCLARVAVGGLRDWPAAQLVLQGHADSVTSVGFSPDGKRIRIVSGSRDKTVRVWDVEGGVQIGSPLEGHTSGVTSVTSSPDQKKIASGPWDTNADIWHSESCQDWMSKKLELIGPTSHHVFALYPSVDGKYYPLFYIVISPTIAIAVKRYHICFSSIPSHALPHSDQLVHGFVQHDTLWAEPIKLQDDGWMKGPQGRLMLWIPPALRVPFYSMLNTAVMPRGCCMELDLSQMAHGKEWWKCFETAI